MSSRSKKSVTPKRNISPKNKSSSSEKENRCKTLSRVSTGKNGKKVEDLINDMRISACKTITNVKSSFGGLSYVSFLFINDI